MSAVWRESRVSLMEAISMAAPGASTERWEDFLRYWDELLLLVPLNAHTMSPFIRPSDVVALSKAYVPVAKAARLLGLGLTPPQVVAAMRRRAEADNKRRFGLDVFPSSASSLPPPPFPRLKAFAVGPQKKCYLGQHRVESGVEPELAAWLQNEGWIGDNGEFRSRASTTVGAYEVMAVTSLPNAVALMASDEVNAGAEAIEYLLQRNLRDLIEDHSELVSAVMRRGVKGDDFVRFALYDFPRSQWPFALLWYVDAAAAYIPEDERGDFDYAAAILHHRIIWDDLKTLGGARAVDHHPDRRRLIDALLLLGSEVGWSEIGANADYESLGRLEGRFSVSKADPALREALDYGSTNVEIDAGGRDAYQVLSLTSRSNALALLADDATDNRHGALHFLRKNRLLRLIEDNSDVVDAVMSKGVPVEDFVEFSMRFPARDADHPDRYAEAAALFAHIRGGGVVDDSSDGSAFAHAAGVLEGRTQVDAWRSKQVGTGEQRAHLPRKVRPAPRPKRRRPSTEPSPSAVTATTTASTGPTLPMTGDKGATRTPQLGGEPALWQAEGLDGFQNLRVIGSGGFADVLYGENETGEPVAIKVLRKERMDSGMATKLFQREARILRALRSDSIPRLISSHVDAPMPHFVMEYIDGEDVHKRILSRGPMADLGELLDLANSTADALADIHEHGYLHRDVKPQNVMASSSGFKLIDLGIGKDLNSQSSTSAPRVGTLSFMAPEYMSGADATPASDIFSWGAMMGYAITGLLPYGNYPSHVLMYFVREGKLDEDFLKALSNFRYGGAAHLLLHYVISTSLRIDPAARDLNFRDVLGVLRRLHRGEGFEDLIQ